MGDIDTTGDEKYEHYVYSVNSSAWIVDRVSNYSLYADDNATLARQTIYYYDSSGYGALGSQGALTTVERWLDTELANPTTEYTYDAYGNVLTETDALGRVTRYYYGLRDGTFTFPDRIVNPLDQPGDFRYNLGTGNLLWSEKNNIRTEYHYDDFGRLEKEVFPYDTEQLPTRSYTYNLNGTSPESIVVKRRTTANNTADAYYFYDGFGRFVQVRSPADSGQQVVANIFYDTSGRVEETSNPYFESFSTALGTPSSTANKTIYAYDILDRVIQLTNPDDTTFNITFDHWNISSYDENGHRNGYALDAYDRIVQVFEYNNDPVLYFDYESDTYMTNYSYNAADQLVNITDFEGNEFIFIYDSLGRRTELDDPDIGTWIYSYDLLDNLISQSGGGGNLITGDSYYREYNDLNQLTRVRSGNLSNGSILEEYTYGAHGGRVKVWKPQDNETIYTPFREFMRIVNSSGTYDYLYIYVGSTLVARLNPDGSKWFYHADHLGSTTLITNESGDTVEETFYGPFGAVTSGGNQDKKLYTGQFSDSVDQYYYGARYYKPAWGRFVQPDKLLPNVYEPQMLNRYTYALNNPFKYVDPDGQQTRHPAIETIQAKGEVERVVIAKSLEAKQKRRGSAQEKLFADLIEEYNVDLSQPTMQLADPNYLARERRWGEKTWYQELFESLQKRKLRDDFGLLVNENGKLVGFTYEESGQVFKRGAYSNIMNYMAELGFNEQVVRSELQSRYKQETGKKLTIWLRLKFFIEDITGGEYVIGEGYSSEFGGYLTKAGRLYPTTNPDWKPQSAGETEESTT